MIKKLVKNKNKYFWSKSSKGEIIVGGHNNGRFYGQILLSISESIAVIKMDISNGVTSSIMLADRPYSILTQEYKIIEVLYSEIDEYLNTRDTIINQELNRQALMENVMDLLPKYSDNN